MTVHKKGPGLRGGLRRRGMAAALLLALLLGIAFLPGCGGTAPAAVTKAPVPAASAAVPTASDALPASAEAAPAEDGVYSSKEDVALYIHLYGKLPPNFITKKQAQALGWSGGSLEPYAPGKCIGGSFFGNYEGLLPAKEGRVYTECDIDTLGQQSRGAKRLVFSNDGLIYYTDDHYNSFTLLYGDEGA